MPSTSGLRTPVLGHVLWRRSIKNVLPADRSSIVVVVRVRVVVVVIVVIVVVVIVVVVVVVVAVVVVVVVWSAGRTRFILKVQCVNPK